MGLEGTLPLPATQLARRELADPGRRRESTAGRKACVLNVAKRGTELPTPPDCSPNEA